MVGSAGLISPVSAVDVPAPVGGPPSCTAADGSAAVVAAGACGPGVDCGLPQPAASNTIPITMNCLMGMAPFSCRSPTKWHRAGSLGLDRLRSARRSPPSSGLRSLLDGAALSDFWMYSDMSESGAGCPHLQGSLRSSTRVLTADSLSAPDHTAPARD